MEKGSHTLTFCRSVSLAIVAGLCQTQAALPPKQDSALLRPVETRSLDGTSVDAVAALLAQAQVPGGVISTYESCAGSGPRHFALPRGTLRQGLDYISMIDASRRWTYKNGVVLVGYDSTDHTILNTVIHEVDINPKDALSLAAQRLFETAEAREAIRKANLDTMPAPLGFSPNKHGGQGPQREAAAALPKHFQNITLEEALDSIAVMHGNAVWHFEQFKCGAKSSFRISWPVS